TSASNPSQVRAREVAQAARDGSVATIQSIGRGAMAARNPPVRNLQLMIDVLTLGRSWPSPRFHATTTDCYTGERLVLSQSSNIPISHAVCASASLPGVFGPTWIGDRLCMDGAMCSTSTIPSQNFARLLRPVVRKRNRITFIAAQFLERSFSGA